MRFLRFQVTFGHVVSQSSKIYPKLPRTAQNYQNCSQTISSRNLLNSTKNWDFGFFQKIKLSCIEGAPKHEHTIWIFNLRAFPYAFFNVKK